MKLHQSKYHMRLFTSLYKAVIFRECNLNRQINKNGVIRLFQTNETFHCFNMNHKSKIKQVCRRSFHSTSFSEDDQAGTKVTVERTQKLMERLKEVDVAGLCDADKMMKMKDEGGYDGIKVMTYDMKLRSFPPNTTVRTMSQKQQGEIRSNNDSRPGTIEGKLVGVARTVQCTQPDDFLAIIRGLEEGRTGEVLVVNTLNSTRAVAGGLFVTEAKRKFLAGLIIDGPIRDLNVVQHINNNNNNNSNSAFFCYSTSVVPYSGTIQSIGKTQVAIDCGGVKVSPGDIIFGDQDGVIVGSIDTFESIIEGAEGINCTESKLMIKMQQGHSLLSMTNYDEHFQARKDKKASSLTFQNLD